jgi:tetratricopeptide (TPR) repeat protein
LKEQGTNLFQKGIYQKASLKYLAASEVPGHSADPFVKNRANSCETAMDLINKADTLLTKNNFIEVIATYSTVLFINTNDPIVKKKLSKIYFEMGERKLETDNFGGALIDYENANRYSPSEITERKIVICHNGISKVELAKRRSLKDFIPEISTGIVGIGAGVFALQLNNTWNSKVNQLNSTLAINDISTYRDQYAEAVKYQKKINLRNTTIGIGLAAVAAEGVFLILKRREFRHLRIEAENLSSVKLTYNLK